MFLIGLIYNEYHCHILEPLSRIFLLILIQNLNSNKILYYCQILDFHLGNHFFRFKLSEFYVFKGLLPNHVMVILFFNFNFTDLHLQLIAKYN